MAHRLLQVTGCGRFELSELQIGVLESGRWTIYGNDLGAVNLSAHFGMSVGVNCGILDTLAPHTKSSVLPRANCSRAHVHFASDFKVEIWTLH